MKQLTNAAAEQLVIGSCIRNPEALDAIVERLGAGDFADPRAGTIYSSLCRITMAGNQGSVALVEDLRAAGELDAVGGDRAITYLEGKGKKNVEAVVEAAGIVVELSRKRDQAAAAARVARTLAEGGDPVEDLERLTATGHHNRDGWADLGTLLTAIENGTHRKLEPTLLTRDDGTALLYENRLNIIVGMPEAMKSWCAKLACVQLMEQGRPAVYLDFEESDGTSCVERLCSIALGRGGDTKTVRAWFEGVDGDPNTRLFYYRAATGGLSTADRAQVLRIVKSRAVPLVVLDGVAAAMGSHVPPLEEDKARDVNMWLAGNVWPLVAAGAGVLCVDHVAKNNGSAPGSAGNRTPRGSGAKLAAVSGAAIMAEVKQPGSAWTQGVVDLWSVKDRPGRIKVQTRSGKRLAATLVSTPQPAGVVECTKLELLSPESAAEQAAEKRWDLIAAELITKLLNEFGKPTPKMEVREALNERRRANGGKGWRVETVTKALDFLTTNGWVVVQKDGRLETLALVKLYSADLGLVHADDVKGGQQGGEPF